MVYVHQGLFQYRPIFRQYIRRFLMESIEDGISYVEPRINFLDKYEIFRVCHSWKFNGRKVYVRR